MTAVPKMRTVLMAVLCAAPAAGQDPGTPGTTVESGVQRIQPGSLVLYLADGSVIAGAPTVKQITIDTTFGRLIVPIDKINRFTPGLESRPEYSAKIMGLTEQLGCDQALRRDAAQRELADIGPAVHELLSGYLEDRDAERKSRVRTILETLDEIDEERGSLDLGTGQPIRKRDAVVTTEFTIVGTISPKSFNVDSRYGRLMVKLADIERAERTMPKYRRMVHKSLSVEGANVAPRQFKSSGVRLKRGQSVFIKAGGTVHLTPWGNRGVSSPDGVPGIGWFVQNEIPNGVLVGRIGNNGPIFKIGAKHRLTADRSGMLKLGIGVHIGQNSQVFPGQYDVKIVVMAER